jgi:protein phosphatase
MSIKIKACGISDVGLVRNNNEDVFAELPEQQCFILADGMGGHQAGEIASREAVEVLSTYLQKHAKSLQTSLDEASGVISKAIADVNSHVFKMGRANPELKGMGTTLCILHVQDEGIVFAHVGDSRIYRLRSGKLELLTKDHSLLRELVDLGQIKEHEAGDFHYKNIITRAIGTEPLVQPSIQTEGFLTKDIFILCSDGLSDLLRKEEIESIVNEAESLSLAATRLILLSKKRGGHDNITLLLVQILS